MYKQITSAGFLALQLLSANAQDVKYETSIKFQKSEVGLSVGAAGYQGN